MDLNTIREIVSARDLPSIPQWQEGDSWLAGGTWLYSEPQTSLRRLIDLDGFGWRPVEVTESHLSVAATCKIAELKDWPRADDWAAGRLIDQCCNALLGSFKIWNAATVGGNICLSLPAGPMTSLAAALGATCVVWTRGGAVTLVPAADFVVGNRSNVLKPGDLLRSIEIPLTALRSRTAFRQVSLTPRGRSAALLIGTLDAAGSLALTVTAATVRPVRIEFASMPTLAMLHAAIDRSIAASLYHDDIHGRPDWRRHLTYTLSAQIFRELAGGTVA